MTYIENNALIKLYKNISKFYRPDRKGHGCLQIRVIIFLFLKKLYNHNIHKWIAGAKTVNTLADASKLANKSLLKLNNFEELLYNEEHEVSGIQQFTNTHKNIDESNKSKSTGKNVIDRTSKTPILAYAGKVINFTI